MHHLPNLLIALMAKPSEHFMGLVAFLGNYHQLHTSEPQTIGQFRVCDYCAFAQSHTVAELVARPCKRGSNAYEHDCICSSVNFVVLSVGVSMQCTTLPQCQNASKIESNS
jgi:hypothetical protein